jgi:heterodisulfide reductase subunit A
MSVARSARLEPLEEFELPVNKACLVVGGGIAGMTSALSLAGQGFEVYLVEKEPELGGMARHLHYSLEGLDVQGHLEDVIRQVYRHPLIHVYRDAAIQDVSGYIGNFSTRIKSEGRKKDIRHGAAIIATGAEAYRPTEYLYGQNENVVTAVELESLIVDGDERLSRCDSLVMIQCVGCRNEERNYCSRVCCGQSIKNALELRAVRPDMDIYILYRDMRSYGFKEDFYREASEKNVRFVRYARDDKPEVQAVEKEGRKVLRVAVTDQVLGKRLLIDADMLQLAAAVVPSSTSTDVAKLFKVALSPDGFFQEAHVKLRPVDAAVDGIFLCGTAHYPKHITETISQAYGAAGRAATVLIQDSVTASGAVCEVNESACETCGACISLCTYGAIEFAETPRGKKATVNPILCKGDGLCTSRCPTGAIYLKHFNDEEILSQIDAA